MNKITVSSTLRDPYIQFNKKKLELRKIQNEQFQKLCFDRGIEIEFTDFGPEFTDELYAIWDYGIDNNLITKNI